MFTLLVLIPFLNFFPFCNYPFAVQMLHLGWFNSLSIDLHVFLLHKYITVPTIVGNMIV